MRRETHADPGYPGICSSASERMTAVFRAAFITTTLMMTLALTTAAASQLQVM